MSDSGSSQDRWLAALASAGLCGIALTVRWKPKLQAPKIRSKNSLKGSLAGRLQRQSHLSRSKRSRMMDPTTGSRSVSSPVSSISVSSGCGGDCWKESHGIFSPSLPPVSSFPVKSKFSLAPYNPPDRIREGIVLAMMTILRKNDRFSIYDRSSSIR